MGRYSFKNTVEDYKSISVFWFNQYGYFCGWNCGGIRWTNFVGEEGGSIDFGVSVGWGNNYIRLRYAKTDRFTRKKFSLDYKVTLVSTVCNYGGRRWWFICPLRNCGRRVGVLYLGGGKYFGCRHCYNLTYQSCKDSHKFDKLATDLGLSVEQLKSLF